MPQFEFVELQQFWQLSYQLALKIRRELGDQPFDYVLSINRGGAVLSRILSDALSIELGAFGLRSYVGVDEKKDVEISQKLSVVLTKKRVLVVDEICDTGQTFEKAIEYIQKFNPATVHSAALYVKPHASFHPDFFEVETTRWVVFPYEVGETMKVLAPFLKTDKHLKERLRDYFDELGVLDEAISLEIAKIAET